VATLTGHAGTVNSDAFHPLNYKKEFHMKKHLLKFGIIILLLLVAAGGYVAFRLTTTLSKKNLAETVDLPGCRMIPGAIGPEDFEYIPEANAIVISSTDRRETDNTTGQLYWLDVSIPAGVQTIQPLTTTYPERFAPHGLTYRKTSETGGTLFVISHRLQDEMRHPIEVFSLDFGNGTPKLKHERTLDHELLISPNDLVVLPDGTLFIVNDFQDVGGGFAGQVLDTLFERKRAPLIYYDGQQFHDLHANITSAPGITYVKRGDKEWLYRADYMHNIVQKLSISRNEQGLPTVEKIKEIDLGAGPDNFTVDDAGNVYVAAHYSTGLILATNNDPAIVSPTQIFRISPDDSASLLYSNRGEEISAASVAQVIGDHLVIGQIYEDGLLSCPYRIQREKD
jgi:sugar lactone lactonase YvrE